LLNVHIGPYSHGNIATPREPASCCCIGRKFASYYRRRRSRATRSFPPGSTFAMGG
jgi:hypothetical protein